MSVSAVVPIWNEERTLAIVVETLLACPQIAEVVCVDDGSTDATPAILDRFGGSVVRVTHRINRGKGAALADGIRAASGEIVAFFDADLTGLTDAHVHALLEPLLAADSTVRVALGLFANGNAYAALVSAATKTTFSGVRAYHREDLQPLLGRMEESRFGVEVYLNEQLPLSISRVVPLAGLGSLGKHDKHPPMVAARGYATAVKEVAREVVRQKLEALDI